MGQPLGPDRRASGGARSWRLCCRGSLCGPAACVCKTGVMIRPSFWVFGDIRNPGVGCWAPSLTCLRHFLCEPLCPGGGVGCLQVGEGGSGSSLSPHKKPCEWPLSAETLRNPLVGLSQRPQDDGNERAHPRLPRVCLAAPYSVVPAPWLSFRQTWQSSPRNGGSGMTTTCWAVL